MRRLILSTATAGLLTAPASAEQTALRNGEIGYVLTSLYWSIYQSDDNSRDCPNGFNSGPRQQYEALFPSDGPAPSIVDARLDLEGQTWNPEPGDDGFPFYEPQGGIARGFDLDGQATEEDYRSPEGEPGIDNQLFRTVGCIIGFRGPDGVEFIFENKAIKDERYNRLMLHLEDVDSLENDPEVTVTVYRGLDRLLTDASGERVVPGGSQRVDLRWGKSLIRELDGKIEDGVLTTEPIEDLIIPWMNLSVPSFQQIKEMRLELALNETGAKGMIGGYADVETWYRQLMRNDSTHHLSNGDISAISLYKQLRRTADGHPHPETGAMTSISTALDAEFVQVFINAPDETKVSSRTNGESPSESE
ncbi:hypothetical protein HK107_07415 [Parvularcula sp. ZS-1/3]|uniref:Uncharacterized protein n=1 Tax=Parvularcula mediterranea TaxID=2732508 RepID=A0A7Y3W5C1_9PROT|nr:hypothetical protein [Parvularcula mediterranea]NNU16147.1 hypothetical protein [Parvularcula mediterranea]